jgi:hypothetical protein
MYNFDIKSALDCANSDSLINAHIEVQLLNIWLENSNCFMAFKSWLNFITYNAQVLLFSFKGLSYINIKLLIYNYSLFTFHYSLTKCFSQLILYLKYEEFYI